MTIFILSPFESKMAKRGTRHPRLAEFLAAEGHEVEYVTGNFSHARKEHFPIDEIRHHQNVLPYKLSVLKIFGYNDHLSIRRVLVHLFVALRMFVHLLPRLADKDIVVIPSRPPELIFAISVLKLRYDIRMIVDIRDVWPDSLPTHSKLKFWIFRIYCNIFLYPSLPRADRFLHTAPSFAAWLKRYAPNKRSTFIPLGYDAKRWQSTRRIDGGESDSVIELVYVGAVTRQIDLSGVLRAVTNDARYRLIIIGDGESLDDLKRTADLIEMNNIVFTGFIPYEDVVEQMKSMHIGIIPMTGHAMPNKFFDYIAACRPILALGDNDAARFALDYDIGWQEPFDDSALKLFFRALSLDEIKNKAKRVESIRDQFSKESLYREYIKIIENR
jgi:hypothetical protein